MMTTMLKLLGLIKSAPETSGEVASAKRITTEQLVIKSKIFIGSKVVRLQLSAKIKSMMKEGVLEAERTC